MPRRKYWRKRQSALRRREGLYASAEGMIIEPSPKNEDLSFGTENLSFGTENLNTNLNTNLSLGTTNLSENLSFGTKNVSFGTEKLTENLSFGTKNLSFGTENLNTNLSLGTTNLSENLSFGTKDLSFGTEKLTENFSSTNLSYSTDNELRKVQGNFNQADPKFLEYSGRQCVANSCVAITFDEIKSASCWESKDLDLVLETGNEFYGFLQTSMTTKEQFILVSELPHMVELFSRQYTLSIGESYVGFVMQNSTHSSLDIPFVMSLKDALETSLGQFKSCFVTFASSTFAVIKRGMSYFVFDSHSRSRLGTQMCEGTSILIQYGNISEVCDHCLRLATSLNVIDTTQFEITGIDVKQSHDNIEEQCVGIPETTSKPNLPHNNDLVLSEPDLIFEHYDWSPMGFNPIDHNISQSLCSKLGICNKWQSDFSTFIHDIGVPCNTIPIQMDGNCFFRAISYAISGTEDNHRKLRIAAVKHIQLHSEDFKPFLREQYSSVDEYILKSRMKYVRTWATELEILAVSDLLKIDIFTFSSRWLRYSGHQIRPSTPNSEKGIYLQNIGAVHYEVVTSVKQAVCTDITINENATVPNSDTLGIYNKSQTDETGKCEVAKKRGGRRAQAEKKRAYMAEKRRRKECQKTESVSKNEKLRSYKRYHEDQGYRDAIKASGIKKYKTDEEHRNVTKLRSKLKYKHDRKHRECVKNYNKKKYAHDEKYRQSVKARSVQKYTLDDNHRMSVKEHSIQKYALDDKHRQSVKAQSIQKYALDDKHRKSVKAHSIQKYAVDDKHRKFVKAHSIQKYALDDKHRMSVKAQSIQKYALDDDHRESVKAQSIQKYALDDDHRESVKTQSIQKYALDDDHRESVKAQSIQKYALDDDHRQYVNMYNTQKYAHDNEYRQCLKAFSRKKYEKDSAHREIKRKRNMLTRLNKQKKRRKMRTVTESFRESISHGPNHICSVCHRRLFKKQVMICRTQVYMNKGPDVSRLAERCISFKYLHECSISCPVPCSLNFSPSSKLWICFTCHRKLIFGRMPAEAVANNLHVEVIPPELQCLNPLEQHLIALHIPFAKVTGLPRGGQLGVHGPVVCVPSDIAKTTTVLPRCESDDQMIPVKLKRKITYKGHHMYKFVNPVRVKNALDHLTKTNILYGNVTYNKDWVNPLPRIMEEESAQPDDVDDTLPDLPNSENDKNVDDDVTDHGMYMDSCLQPVDIGQEVLDQHFDKIFCIAPAEGHDPVRLLMDESNEAKSFPTLFPTGAPTFHDDREEKITLARYLHTRLMLADSRFAKNTDYIFYAQYISEVNQVLSSVSIALRKSFFKAVDKVSPSSFLDKDSLCDILRCDNGYKFLKPIRGTPVFWQGAQRDLFAMLRQLGIPTWFCSFSSGDMRWTEILENILCEEGDMRNAGELDWAEKCAILKRNPITAARMFDQRFHCFLKDVIMSPANPIGKVIDYFYRIEFQQRGSPHTHCLFWVEDAPKLDKDPDEEVVSFVDEFIDCNMPPADDEELLEIVTSVQRHSKKHSKSCRKKGTVCRFNFPRPPSKYSFISRADDKEGKPKDTKTDKPDITLTGGLKNMSTKEAKEVLSRIWNALNNTDMHFESVNELFGEIGINQEIFEHAFSHLNNRTTVVLERNPCDVWINQYNADLLRCWNANMDIQYVIDAYSCVVYIISYISKAEREMGLLLEHARKEALDGNENAKQAMKKLGGVYLHNREVSAQEAVFRVCNLRLKECSRKVQFIPVGQNPVKMSLPIEVLKSKGKGKDLDADDIWMTSLTDRYMSRPNEPQFNYMCLATFCSEYRVLAKSEMCNVKNENRKSPVFELQNGLGYVQKRSRTNPAVVRYPRFSPTKEPEKYFQSMLQLFLPHWRDSQLKPEQFPTFQSFFENGAVKIDNNELEIVNVIVNRNKFKFEKDAESIDRAEEAFEKSGPMEDAWALICPETEAERLHCLETPKDKDDDSHDVNDLPDLQNNVEKSHSFEIRQTMVGRKEAETLLRSLNDKQREIFYAVRQWCLDKRNGKDPKPLYLYVTGGAGTGKSHVIKTIHHEASRIFAPILPNPDDISVLLTAPTGVAAFNINASTIHSTFSISVDAKLPYSPLGDEKMNSLRSHLANLQILIIDEISMVDQKLMTYVHGRLRQIKQCRDYSPFGNVSVIAIGDFYQLSPVKGKALYADSVGVNLWTDLFCIAELTQIMRQRDGRFAETLNRLRTKTKSDRLDDEDANMLKLRETGENNDSLHIFATNNQVDDHNLEMLNSLNVDTVPIDAEDYYRDPQSGKLEQKENQYIRVFNSSLARRITLAVGARVLLTKNIDVSDGLVNGVFGTVSHIAQTPGVLFPDKVFVVFDNVKVGRKLRRKDGKQTALLENSTPILPQEDRVTNTGGIRRQFPLKLAFACSVHKIQGSTLEKAVVSLDKIFTPGQAYVALSRVTSLEGLVIQDFKEEAIYCNEKVATAMSKMPLFITDKSTGRKHGTDHCRIVLHNIQGLKAHLEDMKSDKRFLECHFICLTETWLTDNDDTPELDGFVFHHKTRQQSYLTSGAYADMQRLSHGGVGIFHKRMTHCEIVNFPVTNLEYLAFYSADRNMMVVTIYRPPSYNLGDFIHNFRVLLNEVEKFPGTCLVMGDFNENILKSSSIEKLLGHEGFVQLVTQPTTENSTLVDHVYVKRADVTVNVIPTYYSYHEAVLVEL